MTVRSSVKPRCPKCQVIVRRKLVSRKRGRKMKMKRVVYIRCKANPRHNQRQG